MHWYQVVHELPCAQIGHTLGMPVICIITATLLNSPECMVYYAQSLQMLPMETLGVKGLNFRDFFLSQ